MKIRSFGDALALEEAAVALLAEAFRSPSPRPYTVMLSGGRTPLGVYGRLGESPVPTSDNLHLLLADERHVPADSPDYNFGSIQPMADALGIDDARVLRVRTELSLDEAAAQYHQDLDAFFSVGGNLALGLLGLGSDGHTASLFPDADPLRGNGRWAIPVRRPTVPHRISVTSELLCKAERLVFLVAAEEKAEMVGKLLESPESVTAGRAVARAGNVEIWTAGVQS